ncbi:MAG TPA: hypothetical protein VF698_06220 [Thermoanaerobaculia bacterium]|jgi:hypothetical protein
MRRLTSIAEWEALALGTAIAEATRQREDATLAASIHDMAVRVPQGNARDAFTGSAYEQLLHLDALSVRLKSLALPTVEETLSPRERIIITNPTRFTLDALHAVGIVSDASLIAAAKDSSARLQLATAGRLRNVTSGRLDLAAQRRFDIPRDSFLRPLHTPVPPLATAPGEFAELGFLVDEAEYDWIRMVPTGETRVTKRPRFTMTHRDARLVTGWSAAALDSRLARGGRWDAALDAARIGRTGSDRGAVLFDPYLFMVWWTSLSN